MQHSKRRVQMKEALPAKPSSPARAPRPRRQGILWSVLIVVGLTGALGWQLLENFHAVIPDAIYRSGQLSPSSLQQHIERYQIRSVINLRGKNANQPWYQEECAMAAHCGARH